MPVDPSISWRAAWKLAREHDWPVTFEAEYLAITRLRADALVTVDSRMAAMASGVVPTASVGDLAGA